MGLLTSSVALLRTLTQGHLAGLVLLATPYFLDLGTDQYADIPLGFSFLAAGALFAAHDREARPGARRIPSSRRRDV